MKLSKSIFAAVTLLFALSFTATSLRAQEPPQEQPQDQGPDAKPKPAARTNPITLIDTGNLQDDNDLATRLKPDTTPLTGAQDATLGLPPILHSFWVPGLQYASQIQSRGLTQKAGWIANNYFIGNIGLLQSWRHSQLAINYSGGGFVSTDNSQSVGQYQQFDLSQAFEWNHMVVQVLEQFSYVPEAQFGFGGGTNLGVAGVGGAFGPVIPNMGNNFVPNQSIYAALGPRYSNATALQITYSLSARSSLTAVGSYGLLNFTDPGNIDNRMTTASLGYNYLLSPESTIGVVYRFSDYQYPGEPQAYGSHVVAFAYSRKITGRLALQFTAGPQIIEYRVPVAGQSTNYGANITASLTYGFRNGALTASYLHGLTGGSGAYTGSTSDQVTFGLIHKLGRVWNGQANFGYSHNGAIANLATTGLPTYNNWYLGGGVNRPIGPSLNLAVTYTANIAHTIQSGTGCLGAACNTSLNTQYITLNFQWHSRPLVME